jgi:hypothetical protein
MRVPQTGERTALAGWASRPRTWAAMLLLLGIVVTGCGGPGRVEFTEGHCYIDGQAANRDQIETHQAAVTKRILDRQPYVAALTAVLVALAGMGIVERLLLLFSSRAGADRKPGDRVRALLERYRGHRVRYFGIVTSTLVLLALTAGGYIYLDVDRRASERALGTLQFCHLALRNADEQRVFTEQRQNLEAIQATATDIRALVDKLPPAEQRKAREIVDELGTVLGRQGKLVGEYLQRSDASARMVREHNQAVVRGLVSLEARVTSLKSVPAALRDLSGEMQGLGGRLGRVEGRQLTEDVRLASMEAALKALAARSERSGGTCVCGPAGGAPRLGLEGKVRGGPPPAKPAGSATVGPGGTRMRAPASAPAPAAAPSPAQPTLPPPRTTETSPLNPRIASLATEPRRGPSRQGGRSGLGRGHG